MTLLELLRQELPKRGGWPEGAAKATSYSHIPGVHFWDSDGFRVDFNDLTTRTLGCEEVTREQYGWDGVGLPPIGVECKIIFKDDMLPEWFSFVATFIGTNNIVALVGMEEIAYKKSELLGPEVKFRPLRTEAERAIDEMVRLSGVSIGAAKILHDVGYRK